jgi:cytochrome c2
MKINKNLQPISISIIVFVGILFITTINACAPTKAIAAKSGVQLWSENCQRCHNTPSPSTFSPEIWETVGMHMQTRALLTENERDKIVDFLKSAR